MTRVDYDTGKATAMSGKTTAWLVKREDGWYDQHIHGNASSVARVQFGPTTK